jgi:AcrR family transcriptional regulator
MAKKEETRRHIMKVALKLFSSEGYYQTTTKQIAEAAGVNEITLFRHFGTKENLFQETTEHYVMDLNIKDEINTLIADEFEQTVINIARDYLDFCFQNKKLYKIQMRLADSEKEFVRLKLSRDFANVIQSYFETLKKEGKVNGDPKLMSVTLIESVLGAFTVYIMSGDTFTHVSIHDLVDEHAKQFANYYRVD